MGEGGATLKSVFDLISALIGVRIILTGLPVTFCYNVPLRFKQIGVVPMCHRLCVSGSRLIRLRVRVRVGDT